MKDKSYWFIPGYGHPALLVIKITKVEESENNKIKGNTKFHWISEPIGHALTDDELMTKTEAKRELKLRKEALKKPDSIKVGKQKSTLHNWRIGQANFIISTYPKDHKITVKEFLKQFPAEKDVEWFS